jgi:hypothetical protein
MNIKVLRIREYNNFLKNVIKDLNRTNQMHKAKSSNYSPLILIYLLDCCLHQQILR